MNTCISRQTYMMSINYFQKQKTCFIKQINEWITHKITTFPSEHSTPNQEQGLILSPTPSLSPHFDKAPKGSLTTLSRNLNSAIPASSYSYLLEKTLWRIYYYMQKQIYIIYIYNWYLNFLLIIQYLRCSDTMPDSDSEETATSPASTPPCWASTGEICRVDSSRDDNNIDNI